MMVTVSVYLLLPLFITVRMYVLIPPIKYKVSRILWLLVEILSEYEDTIYEGMDTNEGNT